MQQLTLNFTRKPTFSYANENWPRAPKGEHGKVRRENIIFDSLLLDLGADFNY